MRYYFVVPVSTITMMKPLIEENGEMVPNPSYNEVIADKLKRFSRMSSLEQFRTSLDGQFGLIEIEYNGEQYVSEWTEDPANAGKTFNPRAMEYEKLVPYVSSGLVVDFLAWPESLSFNDHDGNPRTIQSIFEFLSDPNNSGNWVESFNE